MEHIYKYENDLKQIRHESVESLQIDKIDTENRILLHVKGAQFPLKSYPSSKAIFATNILKSILLESIKYSLKPQFIFGTLYTLLFKVESTIDTINKIGFKIVSPYIIKEQYQTEFTNEFQFLIFNFLLNYGISEEKADKTAELIAHVLETDDAYRTRVQDLITSVGSLEPNKIKEYIKLSKERDYHGKYNKFILVLKLARIALFVPKFRNAWGLAIKSIDISKLQLDDADIYWSYYKGDYKYLGLNNEERKKLGEAKGWKYI